MVEYVVPKDTLIVHSWNGAFTAKCIFEGIFYKVERYFSLAGGKVPIISLENELYYPLRSKRDSYIIVDCKEEAIYLSILAAVTVAQKEYVDGDLYPVDQIG